MVDGPKSSLANTNNKKEEKRGQNNCRKMISCFTKHGWILICFIRIMNQSLHKVDQGLRRSGVEEAIIKREKLMESHHMEEYSSCFLELDLLPLLLLCFGTYSPFIARFFSSFCLQLPPFSSRHDTKPPLKFTSNSFLVIKIRTS